MLIFSNIFTSIPEGTWLITEFWVVVGTVIANTHYIHWLYGYLAQYPEILYQSEKDTLYILTDYNRRTYQLPDIPTDLTQYIDGELPAELLRQFPVDSNR